LDVWGFEIKRSDSSFITRRMQERVFNMLLREDKNKEEILEYIGEEIDKIRKGYYKFTELGIPKGMSKDPHSYINKPTDTPWLQKGLPANVRGTLYSIHQLKNDISNKPKLLYVKQLPESYPPIDVICFDNDNQIPPGTQIDTEKMLDKIIRAKLDTVFSGLGWSLKDLVPWWRGKAPKGGEALTMFNLDDFKVTGTSKP
jgi:DNA polymerase I